MVSYVITDDRFFERLFDFDAEKQRVKPDFFLSFHKEMFNSILGELSIIVTRYSSQAFIETLEKTFMDIGFFLKGAQYLGDGRFLKEAGLEYRTDVFEIMAFISVNMLQAMPIMAVSIGDSFDGGEIPALALEHPNEHAVLSLYSQFSAMYCQKYGLARDAASHPVNLRKIIGERDKYVISTNSFQLMTKLLRG